MVKDNWIRNFKNAFQKPVLMNDTFFRYFDSFFGKLEINLAFLDSIDNIIYSDYLTLPKKEALA